MGEKPLFIKKKTKLLWIILFIVLSGFIGGLLIHFVGNDGEIAGIKIYQIISKPPGELVFRDSATGAEKNNLVILVMGLDESRDERGVMHHKGSRTDTIFLLGLDSKARRLGILSVPRDTWLRVSDRYGMNRVNTAYADAFWDEYQRTNHNYEKAKAAGIAQARRTLEDFLNVKVDHFVLLRIKAASEMVDSLGGIMVDVEKNMDYDDNWGHLHIHLKKGRQRLNGTQVVGYSRFRHDEEGDWGRIRRQHQVIQALVNELKKPTHIMHIDRIARVIKSNIDTDMDLNQLIDLARVYKEFNKENVVKGIVIGDDEIIDNSMVVRPNEVIKERLVNRLLKNPGVIPADRIWVKVLNGCGVTGLGGRTADLLRKDGYTVVEVGNAEKEGVKTTIIQDHFLNSTRTKIMEKDMKLNSSRTSNHRNKGNGDTTLDYTIILGTDMKEALSRSNDRKYGKENNGDSKTEGNR